MNPSGTRAIFALAALTAFAPPPAILAQLTQNAATRIPASRRASSEFLARRGHPASSFAWNLIRAREKRAAMVTRAATSSATQLNPSWQAIGPLQVTTSTFGDLTGRVSSIAADPADATGNTLYVGTTGGGLWKSTNAAADPAHVAFQPLTDDLPAFTNGSLASLSIGAVSIQPGGSGVILAGTGDPNDALDSYFGSGLLRSSDNGLTWTLIQNSSDATVSAGHNFYFIGNAFAGFAWSSSTPNLVVAAVSQSLEGALVGAPQIPDAGQTELALQGLYYSSDAGLTWFLATITDGPGRVVQSEATPAGGGGNAATSVVWNPIRKRFYAAVRFHGYYESTDGITWTRLASQPGLGLTSTECPTNPQSLGSQACPIFRGTLAVQPATGDLFAITVDLSNLDQGLWMDTCNATASACKSSTVAFNQQLPTAALEDSSRRIPVGDYALALTAISLPSSTSSPDTLLLAGTQDIFRCTLSTGCQWRNTTNTATCAAAQVAPFQHTIDATFASQHSLVYFGNDGGLWRSTDLVDQANPPCDPGDASHFQNLNDGLGSLAEVVDFDQHPTDSGILLAGVSALGTAATSALASTKWPQVVDGDGSYVAIDPANPSNWYAQTAPGVAIALCTDGPDCTPGSFASLAIGLDQVGDEAFLSPLPSPFLLDPLNSQSLLLGTCHVWQGPADGAGWSSSNLLGELYPGQGPTCDAGTVVQSLAASGPVAGQSKSAEFVYAGMAGLGFAGIGAYSGHLFRALIDEDTSVPPSWTNLWLSPVSNGTQGFNPQHFPVSSIAIDPHDASRQTIYATIAGFSSLSFPTGLVYSSNNAGASWTNITSNLPSVPVNSLVIDPNDANTVYVALDTGVYVTTAVSTCATQNCWSVYGVGLPNSPVTHVATFNSGGVSLLRASTYGRGIWQTALVTAKVTVTTATATPASLAFSVQAVQTSSAPQTVTITNTGAIALTPSSITASGDFSQASACGNSIPIGGSCLILVTFTPTSLGMRTGTLTLYANVAGGQLTVPLTGSAIAAPAIVLLPASLDFGSSPIGTPATPAKNITISNTGGTVVTLQSSAVSGSFSITADTCSTRLPPNTGCTVAVTFTPTASGLQTGTFTISDSLGTQAVPLSGTGISPATDTLSPSSLAFAPQVVGSSSPAQSVTLTNSGDAPLPLISTKTTGSFQAVNGCGNSLSAHSACAISVVYTPKQAGAETGSLVVNDIYGKPQTVALSGTGIAPAGISALPASLDFGPWGVSNTTAPLTITVTDNGGVPLSALAAVVTGDFAISANSCASTLPAGGNCTIQIVFTPSQSGPRSGSIALSSSSIQAPVVLPLTGSGFAFQLQSPNSSATIAAGQTATYTMQAIPASGSNGTLTLSCGSVPKNATCTLSPATIQLASGITTSFGVSIATAAASSLAMPPNAPSKLWFVALLPFTSIVFTRARRPNLLALALSVLLSLITIGCGVSASAGSSAPSGGSGGSTATPPTTYNPTVTATGPGVTVAYKLSLTVD